MKRLLILFAILGSLLPIYAQFSIQGTRSVGVPQEHIDTVFVLDGMVDAKLSYQDTVPRNFSWNAYNMGDETVTPLAVDENATTTTINLPAMATGGYRLDIEGLPSKWVWVFNNDSLSVKLEDLQVNTELEDRCTSYQIELDYTAKPLQYDTLQHNLLPFELSRNVVLSYDSTYYNQGAYVAKTVNDTIALAHDIIVPSPLDNTVYRIIGDTWAIAFGKADSIESELVQAYAVAVNLEASVRIREDALNEGDKDISSDTKLAGSAPLNIEILNNASPASFFNQWCLSTDKNFSNCMIHSSETDFRYTFEQHGTYYLQLEVTNNVPSDLPEKNCISTSMYTIEVVNSLLEVPNVFTPNGDGKNDEFRVSYKSLISFKGYVYNMWGRLLYAWDDPAKGWDGTIGGVPAAEGAYMYIIEAVGADKDEDGKPMKYVYRGDINLLR